MKNFRMILIGCFLMIAACAKAQSISGRLVDERHKPLPYANVVLQQTDSTFVKGETSDEKGSFRFSKVVAGNYRLVISSMGYESLYLNLQGIIGSVDLGTLTMKEASEVLEEVNVTANAIVKKVDKQIVFPTKNQLKSSSSGYDLLAKLLLPDLRIDPIQNKIATLDGGKVEIRINDVKATQAQVSSLRPSEVLRIEYVDNPGIRYGDNQVEAVINYIVKRQVSGISGGIQGMNAVTTGFGNDNDDRGFELDRSYLGYQYDLSKGLQIKGVMDIGQSDDVSDYHRIAYIKNAQISWKTGKLTLTGGLISTIQFNMQEKFWGYRYIMKSFQDLYKFGNSADLGISATYKFTDWLSADAIVVNGEGYKKIQKNDGLQYGLGATIEPFKGFRFNFFFKVFITNFDISIITLIKCWCNFLAINDKRKIFLNLFYNCHSVN